MSQIEFRRSETVAVDFKRLIKAPIEIIDALIDLSDFLEDISGSSGTFPI